MDRRHPSGVIYCTYKVLTPPNPPPPPAGRTATITVKVDGYKAQTINITLDPE